MARGSRAAVLCLLEVYAHAPSGAEIRACLSKHFAHWHACERLARAHNTRRTKKALPPERIVEPRLWIIAPAVSTPLLRKLKLDAARDWPAGVYFHGDTLYRVGIVIAAELPRDRSTLLVRIMAGGPGLAAAVSELTALPADAYERAIADQIVLHLREALGKQPGRTPEEEELVVKLYAKWEQEKQHARAEASARSVLTVLRTRGIDVSDAAKQRILAQRDPERLERWLEKAVVATSVTQVIRDRSRAA